MHTHTYTGIKKELCISICTYRGHVQDTAEADSVTAALMIVVTVAVAVAEEITWQGHRSSVAKGSVSARSLSRKRREKRIGSSTSPVRNCAINTMATVLVRNCMNWPSCW